MKRLVVTEHTRIERCKVGEVPKREGSECIESHLYDRLKLFDRKQRKDKDNVFDWRDGFVRTTQWVGVVQIPGLQIEILPKIDDPASNALPEDDEAQYEARRNLLYMLSVSGDVPVRSRDVARLAIRKAALSETLARIFADRLHQELLRGLERGYIEKQGNIRQFKGKLLVSEQALHNSAHRERFYCCYEEFSDDTLMNQVFRACCYILLEFTSITKTQDILRRCLLLLGNVSNAEIQDTDFRHIVINRQNERFEDILDFCRLLLSGRMPMVQAGQTNTFSLLFDMNKVFERFIAAFIQRYVAPRLDGIEIFLQAKKKKLYLMKSEDKSVLRLEPDLVIESHNSRLIIDTKWKILKAKKRGLGVSDSDLYQLYAYTRRYGCTNSILLYPYTPDLEPKDFKIIGAEDKFSGEQVSIRQVNLHRNLYQESERQALIEELEAIIREGLQLPQQTTLSNLTEEGRV